MTDPTAPVDVRTSGRSPRRCGAHALLGLIAALVTFCALAASADADLFWSSLPPFCFEASCQSFIGHANQDGTGANSEFAASAPHGLVQSGEYLYGTVGPSIGREKTDGTGLEPAFIVLPGAVKGANEYEGEETYSKLAVQGEYLYWASCHRSEKSNLKEGEIGRAKLDGSEVIPNFIKDDAGLGDNGACIEDVAADAGHLYWTRENGTIGRANLNGSGVELEFVKGVPASISGFAVNEKYIYWDNYDAPEIGRSTINGAEVNNSFIKLTRKIKPSGGGEIPPSDGGIALDEGHIYWAEETTIGRANLDGSDVEESFIPNALAPPDGYINGLAIGTSHPSLKLSIAALSEGSAWSTGAEGVGRPLTVKVTIENPATASEGVTGVTPASITVTAPGALTSAGPPSPAVPAGGWSLAPGASVSFTEPYQIAEPGQATISDSVTWSVPHIGPSGPATGTLTVPLGAQISGTTYGRECTETGCRQSGLPDQTILVTGAASDGTPISRLASSQSNGTWKAGVPAGVYTVGPSNDGANITGDGFTPEQYGSTAVAGNNVEGKDFVVCLADGSEDEDGEAESEDGLDALTIGSRGGDLRMAVAHLASTGGCEGTYSFTVEAGIPLARFVDPSSRAPYAVDSAGTGYRADNEESSSNWYEQMPDCSKFEVRGKPVKTRPVKWLTYYNGDGSGGLGSATVNLTWDRYTRDVKQVTTSQTDGTLTRIYRYDDSGRKGTCAKRLSVVPIFHTRINRLSATFETMISWGFPFSSTGSSGGESPRVPLLDRLAENVAEAAYDKYVEHHVPLGGDPDVKLAAVYTMTELLVHAGFHGATHATVDAAKTGALAMLEEITELETKANTAQILADAIDAYAASKFSYETMDVVVRGKFERVECPLKVYTLYCDDTRLAIDASSDRFPQYRLRLSRYGSPLPTASDLAAKIAVVPGAEAVHLPEVNETDLNNFSLAGSAGAEAALERALKVVRPNALAFRDGANTSGNIPAAFPYCTEKGLPATPHAICFTFLDNRA